MENMTKGLYFLMKDKNESEVFIMKKLLSFMIFLAVLSTAAVPVSASEPAEPESLIVMGVEPRLNNGNSCSMGFTITNTGLANLNATYSGISGVTSRVTVTMSIEKKISSTTWQRIDIGTVSNSWVDSSTNFNGAFSHTHQLEAKGTYRAVFVIKMFGSGGTADKIEKKIEKVYS